MPSPYGSPSFGGVLFNELRATMYNQEERPLMLNFIAGLGGREIRVREVNEMVDATQRVIDTGKVEQETTWIGVRE